MPRLVREVGDDDRQAGAAGHRGRGTEVDKTVIERLTDPLTHMIRNAIDHGLETPEKRARRRQAGRGRGAPDRARIAPAASSSRSPTTAPASTAPRVKEIAIDKGLIAADAQLTDEEIDNLIFLPGFSTAVDGLEHLRPRRRAWTWSSARSRRSAAASRSPRGRARARPSR